MIDPERLTDAVAEALELGRSAARNGRCADYIPELANAEEESGRPRNPFINAGAIVVCSRTPTGPSTVTSGSAR